MGLSGNYWSESLKFPFILFFCFPLVFFFLSLLVAYSNNFDAAALHRFCHLQSGFSAGACNYDMGYFQLCCPFCCRLNNCIRVCLSYAVKIENGFFQECFPPLCFFVPLSLFNPFVLFISFCPFLSFHLSYIHLSPFASFIPFCILLSAYFLALFTGSFS
jgi:hypothetical protein